MKIRFWGVRGSIPCPGPHTVKYGGNTPCIEVRFPPSDRFIIIDAGSGIRELGNHLVASELAKGPIHTDVFLTHTHWDHIMGFPFFTPIYIPGTELKVYGPVSFENETLENIVGGQLTYRYFPVRRSDLASKITYVELKERRFDLGGGVTVGTKYLNHPVLCLGYRFEFEGKVLCTAYDTEPFQNVFCTDPADPSYDEAIAREGEEVAREQNANLKAFFAGADLLIYDAQYTREEYDSAKRGWGHSTFDDAVAAAEGARAKNLAFFHHEPVRTDHQIDELAGMYVHKGRPGGPNVFFAREGMEICL